MLMTDSEESSCEKIAKCYTGYCLFLFINVISTFLIVKLVKYSTLFV